MFQLKFNNDFKQIVTDIPHWKDRKDIPDEIIKFMMNASLKKVFYEEDTGLFYCGKCVERLDQNNYCLKCNQKYHVDKSNLYSNRDIVVMDKVAKSFNYQLSYKNSYFIFDVVGENVYLYHIEENVSYDNPFFTKPYKSSTFTVDTSTSYLIQKEGLTNLETSNYTSFEFLEKCNRKSEDDSESFFELMENDSKYQVFEQVVLNNYDGYLYVGNLKELEKTIYKYSKFWTLGEYFSKKESYSISELTLYPLYYPQFEYLVNYKLYNLACQVPNWFLSGKNFREIFGMDKKYLKVMRENDIDWMEFKILKIYPTNDIEVIKFFKEWGYGYFSFLEELIKKCGVDLKYLRTYLLNNNLSSDHFSDYIDYIYMAKELHLDLKDKKVLYPNNLRESHDQLFNQIETVENKEVDEKINKISNILSLNTYEDNDYVIFPADSIESLVEESRQQKNCVRTYCERIASYDCQIYFMRRKESKKKSFVTIEVRNNKIVQARMKYNHLPEQAIKDILEKWEKMLIPIKFNE